VIDSHLPVATMSSTCIRAVNNSVKRVMPQLHSCVHTVSTREGGGGGGEGGRERKRGREEEREEGREGGRKGGREEGREGGREREISHYLSILLLYNNIDSGL
jgi:hypothetical protein